jgi:tripartite ATP-independent transporter DctM subunit
VPPSLVLIVLADQLGRSVGDMYRGALVPALMLASLYLGYVMLTTIVRPQAAPPLPPAARTLHGYALIARILTALVPPLVLIFLVLGTIFMGIATASEAGAMGATGALVLALTRRRLTLPLMCQALQSTAALTSFVVFILVGSTVFGLTFRAVDGDLWVESLLADLPGGALGFLIVTNLLVFLLAFFLDFFEIAFIVIPLLAPVAHLLGIDLVWFGVMLAVNMQTSFMSPPFGFTLFYLRSVAPREVGTTELYRGMVPFLAIQLIMVALVIAFPDLVMHYQGEAPAVDPGAIELDLPPPEAPPPVQFQ